MWLIVPEDCGERVPTLLLEGLAKLRGGQSGRATASCVLNICYITGTEQGQFSAARNGPGYSDKCFTGEVTLYFSPPFPIQVPFGTPHPAIMDGGTLWGWR